MTLYEIDNAIMALIDADTGEISDFDALEALNMERETKIENVALAVKNLTAEAAAIGEEVKRLQERKKAAENKAARFKEFMQYALAGEKFKTPRVSVSYRNTKAVEVDNETFVKWAMDSLRDDLLTFADPEPNKRELKTFLEEGNACEGAELVNRVSVIIK